MFGSRGSGESYEYVDVFVYPIIQAVDIVPIFGPFQSFLIASKQDYYDSVAT